MTKKTEKRDRQKHQIVAVRVEINWIGPLTVLLFFATSPFHEMIWRSTSHVDESEKSKCKNRFCLLASPSSEAKTWRLPIWADLVINFIGNSLEKLSSRFGVFIFFRSRGNISAVCFSNSSIYWYIAWAAQWDGNQMEASSESDSGSKCRQLRSMAHKNNKKTSSPNWFRLPLIFISCRMQPERIIFWREMCLIWFNLILVALILN